MDAELGPLDAEVDPPDLGSDASSFRLLACCAAAALAFGLASDTLWLAGLGLIAIVVAVLLFGPSFAAQGGVDDEPGQDGGGGPPRPPTGPTGGIPLPDAEQSGRRIRDHDPVHASSQQSRRQVRRRRRTTSPAARR